MDNERFDLHEPEDENWFDGIFEDPAPEKEIGPDEIAVYSAGLTNPADIELEKILAEHRQQEAEDLSATQVVDIYAQEQPSYYQDDATCVIPTVEESDATRAIPNIPSEDDATRVIPAMDETRQIPVPEDDTADTVDTPKKNKLLPRKGRPAMKKGYGLLGIPHILSTAIWAVIILAIGISLGRILWVCCADVMAFGRRKCKQV